MVYRYGIWYFCRTSFDTRTARVQCRGGADSPKIGRGGYSQLFFMSAIAIPQLEGKTSATAYPQLFQEKLLCNCIHFRTSSIAIFFQQSVTSSMQLFKEMLLCNCITHIFASAIFFQQSATSSPQLLKKCCFTTAYSISAISIRNCISTLLQLISEVGTKKSCESAIADDQN
jgi:hypothetical protein